MATYTIFAGVNGAGKTTMYKSIMMKIRMKEELILMKWLLV